MANDFDLYGDLDDALIEPLQEEVEKKTAENLAKFEEDKKFREQTEKTINELQTSNSQLKINMSRLLATASAEIERKDEQIKDLRREMDQIIFRKTKVSRNTSEKAIQTDRLEFFDKNSDRANGTRHFDERSSARNERNSNDKSRKRDSPERRQTSRYDKKLSVKSREDLQARRSRSRSRSSRGRHKSPDRRDKSDSYRKRQRDERKEEDLRSRLLKKRRHDDNSDTKSKDSIDRKHNEKMSSDKKIMSENKNDVNNDKEPAQTSSNQSKEKVSKEKQIVSKDIINEVSLTQTDTKMDVLITADEMTSKDSDVILAVVKEEHAEPIPITNADSQSYFTDNEETSNEKSEMIEQLKDLQTINQISPDVKKEDSVTSPITLNEDAEKLSTTTEKTSVEDMNEQLMKNEEDVLPKSANDSLDSTKENSLNNSHENGKHKKKRKIITTEVEDDGTVVFTVVRKKKKAKQEQI